ncbi:hypothetical protein [Candidatus Enterococcus ferrettii]|uniref:Uncharacterized protein n=1 Tax=Candidatus Enterococcus ferrettii TaxID=2815324 RepID=A0ABV0ENF9_9ENTE|nr:hypothetical protein [Enterococcus sp. 665A]MBO1341294.1 hypothetical protein [Enterococcus sp. 665A]
MTIKEIRKIKLVADWLLVAYIYFVFSTATRGSGYFAVNLSLLIGSVLLRDLLPKEYRFGGTFLKKGNRWMEFIIEAVLILSIAFVLIELL